MADLLQKMEPPKTRQKGVPLWLEFQVDPRSAPYLVSSTQSVMWVAEPSSEGLIRAAFRRQVEVPKLCLEMLGAIVDLGHEAQWGNVHPLTEVGAHRAIEHVQSYDLPNVELLVSPKDTKGKGVFKGMKTLGGCPLRVSKWLPAGWAVAVPSDRSFVGTVMEMPHAGILAVVHNPSRGVGVASVSVGGNTAPETKRNL